MTPSYNFEEDTMYSDHIDYATEPSYNEEDDTL